VETEAELDARRAQLKSLMTRVAHEHQVSITHVHQMVQSAARAGAFDISGGDAPTEAPAGDWYDDGGGGPPPPQPPRRRRRADDMEGVVFDENGERVSPYDRPGRRRPPGPAGADGPRGPQGPQGPARARRGLRAPRPT
jgi:hypothetical protein